MNTETYTRAAMGLLRTKDGQSTVEARVKAAVDKLAAANAAHKRALDRVTLFQERHRSLNDEAANLTGKYIEKQNGLLDEYVLGNPPRDEFAASYDRLNCESRFINASISRLVEHHLPLAHRGVLVTQVAVAQAEFEQKDAEALAAMFTRVRLIQPLLTHEEQVEVHGGTTERAIEAAKSALLAYTRLQEALAEYDRERRIA